MTLPDITLEFTDVVSPVSLDCEEELESEEVESPDPYAVDASCFNCHTNLRIVVVASPEGIRGLQLLLFGPLSLLCPACATRTCASRRPQRNGS